MHYKLHVTSLNGNTSQSDTWRFFNIIYEKARQLVQTVLLLHEIIADNWYHSL